MTTGSRIRPHVDIGRLRDAIAGPGADPRNWCGFARVDDDDDAVRWDDVLGWLVDVTFVGGQLDGEGPCPCRVAWSYLNDGAGRSDPPERNAQCIVAIPEGDPNVMPVVLGFLSDPTLKAPTSVNGTTVDEAFALANHLWRSARGVQWDTSDVVWSFPSMRLADADADQRAVRGDDQKDGLGAFLTSLDQWAELVRAGILAGGGTLDNTALIQATQDLRNALEQALSSRVKLV